MRSSRFKCYFSLLMKPEHHINKYFRPVGLRRKTRKVLVESLKPQKHEQESNIIVDSLQDITGNKIDNNVETSEQINANQEIIEKISTDNDVTKEKDSGCISKIDFTFTSSKKSSKINFSLNYSDYRKNSLLRAKNLVSKALTNNMSVDLKVGKTVTSPTLKNKFFVRKRLFDLKDKELTSDDDSPATNSISTPIDPIPKYEKLKDKLPIVPAFKRFKHLIDKPISKEQEYPFETNFSLPVSYEKILQFYRAADAVLYIMHQRKEGCNFLRLKKMIEASTKKSFWRSDLAQIVGLRPNDFKLYLNENPKGMTNLVHNGVDKRDSLLMISPDYTEALQKFNLSESPISTSKYERSSYVLDQSPKTPMSVFKHVSPKKTPQLYSPICVSPTKSLCANTTPLKTDSSVSPITAKINVVRPSHLTWRKDQVRSLFLRKTHDQHKLFLKQVGLENTNYTKLKQWHEKFNLDEVEPIEEALLPDAFKFKSVSTAKDLLAGTADKLNNVIRKAVEDVVKLENNDSPKTPTNKDDSSGVYCLTPVCQKVLSSIPNSLIEKIREKEKMNASLKMMIKQDDVDEKNKLQKLPELLKLMFNYLRSEKKTCMVFPKVVEKMMQSSKQTISRELMEEQIVLLSEVVPDLVSIPTIGNHRFVKIVQIKCTLNDALAIIEEKLSKTSLICNK